MMPKSRNGLPVISDNMGTRIRQLRESQGMTCEQFGHRVGVSKAAVSFWENSQTLNIKLETFLRVLEVLQTDFEYLLYGVKRRRGKGKQPK